MFCANFWEITWEHFPTKFLRKLMNNSKPLEEAQDWLIFPQLFVSWKNWRYCGLHYLWSPRIRDEFLKKLREHATMIAYALFYGFSDTEYMLK